MPVQHGAGYGTAKRKAVANQVRSKSQLKKPMSSLVSVTSVRRGEVSLSEVKILYISERT
jgi:hypothetical protein